MDSFQATRTAGRGDSEDLALVSIITRPLNRCINNAEHGTRENRPTGDAHMASSYVSMRTQATLSDQGNLKLE
eukprot:scaffold18126_cov33-Prasinocladus_malaysianus.AAC.1